MPPRGLTLEQIVANEELHTEHVKKAKDRYKASRDYYQDKLDSFIRFYKIYRAIVDEVDDPDEPNTGASYAFGVIEDTVAAISESILNARVPTPARHRRAAHEKSARNFNAMAATYFSTGQYQEDYPNGVRERAITGNNWEMDAWSWEYAKARRWEKVKKVDILGGMKSMLKGTPLPDAKFTYDAMEEVEYDKPVRVGYHTRFPSVFNVLPQPRVTKVERMKWILEVEERVALEDLEAHQFIDPATGERTPFFNLEALKRLKAEGGRIKPTPMDNEGKDFEADKTRALENLDNSARTNDSQDDTDQVSLLWVWEPEVMWCVANGQHVIAYREHIFPRPMLPYRLKGLTPQKDSLYAVGMIEPVENLYYEQDDIHKLSMRNWVRIINRMVAYNPDDVPHAEQDFAPRAGGKVRVRPGLGQSIASSIMPIDQADVTSSMIAQESNNKGLIERALGMPDFSQGVEGTKQDHDTLGGMQLIESKAAKRVASIRRQEMASFQRQMHNMEAMYSHFLVEKMPFTAYGPDGSTAMLELDLWDIDTQGEGFDYIYEYDPTFGDDALMRNQMAMFLDQGIKYNQAALTMGGPATRFVDLSEVMDRLSRAFGWSDTSKILKRRDGAMDPQAEFEAMLAGKPVAVNPAEDLVAHYLEHIKTFQDPALHAAAQKGQVPPDVLLRLKTHIEETGAAIMAALKNPDALIRAKMFAQEAAEGMRPGMPAGPGQMPPAPGDRRDRGLPGLGGPRAARA